MQNFPFSLRLAEDADLPTIARLSRFAFVPTQSDQQVQEGWFSQGVQLPDRRRWVVTEAQTDRVVATYAELELQIACLGSVIPAIGLGGVAVAPECRGQSIAHWMLTQAIHQAQAQQVPLLMLYPFQHGFYRSLGWGWVGQVYQYPIAPQHLPKYPRSGTVQPITPRERPAVQALYQQVALQNNGWLLRSDLQWEAWFQPLPGQDFWGYWEGETLLGYVLLGVEQQAIYGTKAIAVVREWVAVNPAGYRGILAFLRSLRDQFSLLIWHTHSADPFPHLLQQQDRVLPQGHDRTLLRFSHRLGEIGSSFMWRLVDCQAALTSRPVQPTAPFSLALQVQDAILGNSQWWVDCADGRMTCTPLRSRAAAPAILTLSIEHLSVLFAGTRTVEDLLWTEEVQWQGDRTILTHLTQAWQGPPPFCWDFF
ncbi:GNAT family N-acetyltransferase [Alkalinema sp. FACHB-956]|uniref:GNAT family N-acetyltransferase n=1 Tax=Alkalinema sp. FACHB-956 TaxID=2692768 RepID=UPI001687A415|nr:GNAT family N-acetyltransferase [Alkalinema sp. FACHB-956]MBD2326840.1 GNAT family N-acetyltransferase [Alkalinema sp. FACHB-956]